MPNGLFDDFFAEEDKKEESPQADSKNTEENPAEDLQAEADSKVLIDEVEPEEESHDQPSVPVNRIEALLDSELDHESEGDHESEEQSPAFPEEPDTEIAIDADHSSLVNPEIDDPENNEELESTFDELDVTEAELEEGSQLEITDTDETADQEDPVEAVELAPEVIEKLNTTSQPFVQRWNSLISTTNWEKGAIIQQWREALIADDAPVTEYSDDTWAQRVGGVSGQHVGRLRRVFARFGQSYSEYGGLYWSHFHASIDWDDAELWLEGAVQNRWSVSQMREQRWEATGADSDQKPREEDITVSVIDEDYLAPAIGGGGRPYKEEHQGQTTPRYDGPDFGDGSEKTPTAASDVNSMDAVPREVEAEFGMAMSEQTPVQPFRDLDDLPEDLSEAFDMFKLGILRHKSSQWEHVKLESVLSSLDALKQLATAPSMDSGAPF